NIVWRPLVTICGVKLVTLATTAADPGNVYAIGMTKVTQPSTQVRGLGLYKINPDNVDPNMVAVKAFNRVGNLEITADRRALETAAPPNTEATSYQSIVGVRVPNLTPLFPGNQDSFPVDAGRDDIAVFAAADGAERETIYVVTGPAQGTKALQAFG